MKALTVGQPSAWAIAAGHKVVENRSKPTSFRGRFYVHAAAWHAPDVERWMRSLGLDVPAVEELAFGAVIGEATLDDVIPRRKRRAHGRADVRTWSSAGAGGGDHAPHLWLLSGGTLYPEPYPMRGQLGFWSPLQWTCHICGDERLDALIAVHTNTRTELRMEWKENVRYCRDRPTCAAAAPDHRFTT